MCAGLLWSKINSVVQFITEPAFTCSKSLMETPDECVKFVDNSILRSIMRCVICLGCFFQIYIYYRPFYFSWHFNKIVWTSTLHTNVCSRYILEALHLVWDLSKFENTEVVGSCCNTLVCYCASGYPYEVFFKDICL